MEKKYIDELRRSLALHWDSVVPLTQEQARTLFEDFVNKCVKPDFTNKFKREFNSRRAVEERFFKSSTLVNINNNLEMIFEASTSHPIKVTALWGSYEDPVAFALSGKKMAAWHIFVTSIDSLAIVMIENKIGYLLFSQRREALYEIFP